MQYLNLDTNMHFQNTCIITGCCWCMSHKHTVRELWAGLEPTQNTASQQHQSILSADKSKRLRKLWLKWCIRTMVPDAMCLPGSRSKNAKET